MYTWSRIQTQQELYASSACLPTARCVTLPNAPSWWSCVVCCWRVCLKRILVWSLLIRRRRNWFGASWICHTLKSAQWMDFRCLLHADTKVSLVHTHNAHSITHHTHLHKHHYIHYKGVILLRATAIRQTIVLKPSFWQLSLSSLEMHSILPTHVPYSIQCIYMCRHVRLQMCVYCCKYRARCGKTGRQGSPQWCAVFGYLLLTVWLYSYCLLLSLVAGQRERCHYSLLCKGQTYNWLHRVSHR